MAARLGGGGPAVLLTSVGQIHIGAYRSHTTLFLQLRQKSSRTNNDEMDVRWVCNITELSHIKAQKRNNKVTFIIDYS